MKMLSLFSGIGGIDMAAQWAGIETVAFCEIDPFCQKVLKKHWPDVPIFGDIRTMTKEVLDYAGITGIDIVAGGFPCQPYSEAGKQRGAADDRHLWPEMLRIVSEIRPPWVVGENVAGFVTMGIDDAFADLESLDYAAESFLIPAYGVDDDHERYRVYFMANTDAQQLLQENKKVVPDGIIGKTWYSNTGSCWRSPPKINRSICKPEFLGVVDGFPDRVDRARAIGNAVDPRQIYPIFAAIAAIEEAGHE